ncbi:NAD(P)-binding protein [Tothia fuscella]|uniref:NAD(P)-binding protein n=1 Tax=Tothia fuscella TaxID=1048955 RepID=A0A9P4NMZ9_9PEZI|nr:NAD(P)-binding protein [Tothia fuscella]
MVRIAVAGGTGEVAREIIDVLLQKGHQILIISRKAPKEDDPFVSKAQWAISDYQDKDELIKILTGTHTFLSFIDVVNGDKDCVSQKNMINASIEAGVKRFAPSEWSSSSTDGISWYDGKATIREYLREIKQPKKVLEYTLFQPGLFLNYFGHPHKTTKYLTTFPLHIDFETCRAFVLEGNAPDISTLTTVEDVAGAVASSVEYEGEWPIVTGIQGENISTANIIALGEKIRGRPFQVEKVALADAEAGKLNTSWLPTSTHASIPLDQVEGTVTAILSSTLVAISRGSWAVSDEWNKIFPDQKLTGAEEFLTKVWKGKP